MPQILPADHFKQCREALGLTQSDLAKAFDVSPSTVKRWEKAGPDILATLAIEALVWRKRAKQQAAISPEERARRRFAEWEHLQKLKIESGLVERRVKTPAEKVSGRAELRRLLAIEKRNANRIAQREVVLECHKKLAAAASPAARVAIVTDYARHADAQNLFYLTEYLSFAGGMIVADDSTLITLPLEPMK